MISFIVPAHNEAFELPKTLASIFAAAPPLDLPFEVIVVNDASTDETRALAEQTCARVIDVQLRKISAVRNAGAKAATGEFLFFVDADTQISADVLRAAVKALEAGAVGGGAWVSFEKPVSLSIRLGVLLFNELYMGIMGWAAGCFVFARRDAFQAVGGFDEKLFATEEIELSKALKTQGRFLVVRNRVVTSARKMRMYSIWHIIPFLLRLMRRGPKMLEGREGMEWWYEGKRERK